MSFPLSRTGKSLRHYPAFKLTSPCYSFMEAGRRHEKPRSETMHVITHNIAGSMSFMFS